MKYSRGRVSISIPSRLHVLDVGDRITIHQPPPRGARSRIHIGHARTMLLGELICREYGIPYHLRLEAAWNQIATMHEGLIDTWACASFLRLKPEKVYPKLLDAIPDDTLRAQLPEANWEAMKRVQEQFASIETDRWSSIAEDLEWYPSLMIRGMEFARPNEYGEPDIAGQQVAKAMKEITAFEEAVYQAGNLRLGRAFVPLIVEHGNRKMSKSADGIPWVCLQSVSWDAARQYLMATVANPRDPLSAIGYPVDANNLDPTPHVWSWETWGSYIRSL